MDRTWSTVIETDTSLQVLRAFGGCTRSAHEPESKNE